MRRGVSLSRTCSFMVAATTRGRRLPARSNKSPFQQQQQQQQRRRRSAMTARELPMRCRLPLTAPEPLMITTPKPLSFWLFTYFGLTFAGILFTDCFHAGLFAVPLQRFFTVAASPAPSSLLLLLLRRSSSRAAPSPAFDFLSACCVDAGLR